MTKTHVGVLRGGPSSEYDVSLKTGLAVLEHLPKERYEPHDIFVDKNGIWHVRGRPMEPARALSGIDVVFNALHGKYGEDGTVQRLLDSHAVAYTGSGALGSALGMNKALAKDHVKVQGVLSATYRILSRDTASPAQLLSVFQTFSFPAVLKPVDGGSSVGVKIVRSYQDLTEGVEEALKYDDRILLEEYIAGREATVGIIEGFRDQPLYALPPIEIIPTKREFFDYDEKYAGFAREECPAQFDHETTAELERLARTVHEALNLRHYSRSDFIVNKRGIYFLEVNTLPGLTEASLVPKAVRAVGATFPGFLDHLVTLALARK